MKKTITIIIVVLALGGAVFFAYSALNTSPLSSGQAVPASTILPFGTSLDFKTLSEFNKTNRIFPYPKVTKEEIGNSN